MKYCIIIIIIIVIFHIYNYYDHSLLLLSLLLFIVHTLLRYINFPAIIFQGTVQELLDRKDDKKIQEDICKQLGKCRTLLSRSYASAQGNESIGCISRH